METSGETKSAAVRDILGKAWKRQGSLRSFDGQAIHRNSARIRGKLGKDRRVCGVPKKRDSSKLRENQGNSGKVRETRRQRGALEYKRESPIVVVVLRYSS